MLLIWLSRMLQVQAASPNAAFTAELLQEGAAAHAQLQLQGHLSC